MEDLARHLITDPSSRHLPRKLSKPDLEPTGYPLWSLKVSTSPPRRPEQNIKHSLCAMVLTYIHVRKPQEILEKGSKGKGRRRGLPAPLDPALRLKPLKGPFPGGSKVPRAAPQGRGNRLEDITNSEAPGWAQRTMPPARPRLGDAGSSVPGDSIGDALSARGPRSLPNPRLPRAPASPRKPVFRPLGPPPAPPGRRRPRSASLPLAPAPAPPPGSPLRGCSFRSRCPGGPSPGWSRCPSSPPRRPPSLRPDAASAARSSH